MLARCVELFREGLGCGFEEADASEAQSKRVDKKQAFRALESALNQYADALRRMEAGACLLFVLGCSCCVCVALGLFDV